MSFLSKLNFARWFNFRNHGKLNPGGGKNEFAESKRKRKRKISNYNRKVNQHRNNKKKLKLVRRAA